MTKKIKFITRLLVLTLFSTFISCNDELYDIKNQHNDIDKNKISLTQFKNETNIDHVEPILSVPTKTSIASKSKSQLSDFVIDTIAIKRHISTDNKTTYTFRIYPLSSVAQIYDIYNLVYHKVNNNWETSIFYLKKLPKENSEHKLFEKIEIIYGGKITNAITSKSSSLEMCSYETTSIRCDGNSTCTSNGSCDGFACPTGQCIKTTINYMSCSSGGSSGGGSSDPGNTSGGGGGSSDPYAYSPNYYDNPVYDDPNYINATKRSYVWANLGDSKQYFFANNSENISAFNKIIQYQIDNNWSQESHDFCQEIINILCEDMSIVVDNDALSFLLEAKKQNKIYSNIDNDFLVSVDQHIDLDMNNALNLDPTNPLLMHFSIQCAVLRANHPNWSNLKIYWEASKEFVHITLDILGLVPVAGEIADLTNGALYTIEGDGVNATSSFASAVPVAGWAAVGVKYAVKIKTVATIGTRVKLTWKVLADGTIYFGSNNTCRAQLRKVLGLAVGNLSQAHHIIPLNLQTNPIVQKAAKSGNAFHLNEALNGIPLSTAIHSGSHGHYDNLIFQKLKLFAEANPNATPSQCYNKVNEIISQIRTAIANNPNTPINQLNF